MIDFDLYFSILEQRIIPKQEETANLSSKFSICVDRISFQSCTHSTYENVSRVSNSFIGVQDMNIVHTIYTIDQSRTNVTRILLVQHNGFNSCASKYKNSIDDDTSEHLSTHDNERDVSNHGFISITISSEPQIPNTTFGTTEVIVVEILPINLTIDTKVIEDFTRSYDEIHHLANELFGSINVVPLDEMYLSTCATIKICNHDSIFINKNSFNSGMREANTKTCRTLKILAGGIQLVLLDEFNQSHVSKFTIQTSQHLATIISPLSESDPRDVLLKESVCSQQCHFSGSGHTSMHLDYSVTGVQVLWDTEVLNKDFAFGSQYTMIEPWDLSMNGSIWTR